jgi:hypothetical protein
MFPLIAAEITKLKHSIVKNNKKQKKDVDEQIQRMENEMNARHKREEEEKSGDNVIVRVYFSIF